MKKMCAKCGGSMKSGGAVTKIKKKVKTMAKGGIMGGIPKTGTTNYSAPIMKKGGVAKGNSKGCPEGYYVEYSGGPCLKKPGTFGGPSVKVAGAILGSAGAAIGSYLGLGKRDAKKKAKATAKDVANTAKTLTSKKPMRSGGAVGKRMTTKRK